MFKTLRADAIFCVHSSILTCRETMSENQQLSYKIYVSGAWESRQRHSGLGELGAGIPGDAMGSPRHKPVGRLHLLHTGLGRPGTDRGLLYLGGDRSGVSLPRRYGETHQPAGEDCGGVDTPHRGAGEQNGPA